MKAKYIPEEWLKKFYPVPVKDVAQDVSVVEMVEHAIRKWEGLFPSILRRYKLGRIRSGIRFVGNGLNLTLLRVDSDSCLLCRHFLKVRRNSPCTLCPLWNHLGGFACDSGFSSPYGMWVRTGNPRPMLKALKGLREKLIKEAEKK